MGDLKAIHELYQRLREVSRSEREAILGECERTHPDVVREVRALLEFESTDGNPSEQPTETAATVPYQQAIGSLSQVGPFRIHKPLGKGGMGDVYLGVREIGGVQQLAAIKILKPGVESEDILRRFTVEQRVIASLDHVSIARLLDAGTTTDGRPYYAMEYVDGIPVDAYCDRLRLRIRDRLQLFLRICEAVQHAHQNLIVHRDLKPSNILVTEDGVPKLLDFGIAKLLNPEMSREAMQMTGPHQRLLTPDYASPEQVRGERITTASDVYSLGVIVFELLTGHRPYQITSRNPSDIERVVCEQEPARPSTALLTTEEIATSSGGNTTISPEVVESTRSDRIERLRRQVTGDLDNIVLMALRKEPLHRYQTVNALAEDVQRHLDGHTVAARPPSIRYRTSKFLKRNKASVSIGALVVVAIVTSVVAIIAHSRAALLDARAELLQTTADTAAASAEKWRDEFRDVISESFSAGNQAFQFGPEWVAIRIARAQSDITRLKSLVEEDPTDARALLLLSEAHVELSEFQGSKRGPSARDFEAAKESLQRAFEYCEQAAVIQGSDSSILQRRFLIHTYTADLMDGAEALQEYESALSSVDAWLAVSPGDIDIRRSRTAVLQNIADLVVIDDQDEARARYQDLVNEREALLAQEPDSQMLRRDLATSLFRLGDLEWNINGPVSAEPLFQRALEIRTAAFAASENPRTSRDLANGHLLVAIFYHSAAPEVDFTTAADHYRTCFSLTTRVARENLDDERIQGDLIERLGRIDDLVGFVIDTKEAIQILTGFREVLDLRVKALPFDPQRRWHLARCNAVLGDLYMANAEHQLGDTSLRAARNDLRVLEAANPTNTAIRDLKEEVEKSLAELTDLRENGTP